MSYTRTRPSRLAAVHSPYAWQADVDTTVVIPALSLLYLFAVGRFGASRPPCRLFRCCHGPPGEVAFWSPLHHLGLHYLLTAHLLQNVILAEWAPLLAVLGVSRPMALALAHRRLFRALVRPAVALPVWLVNYYAWHVPPVYDAALDHQSCLIHIEHACYFATGLAMWWPLVQDVPRRLHSGGARRLRVRRVRSCVADRAAPRTVAKAGLHVLRARPDARLGPLTTRRPGGSAE